MILISILQEKRTDLGNFKNKICEFLSDLTKFRGSFNEIQRKIRILNELDENHVQRELEPIPQLLFLVKKLPIEAFSVNS